MRLASRLLVVLPTLLAAAAAASHRAHAEDSPPAPSSEALVRKLEPLLASAEGPSSDANATSRATAYLEQTLRSIGTESLPALERLLLDASPIRAQLVAQAARAALGAAAIPMFERVIANGDAIARGAAWAAVRGLPIGPESRALLGRLADGPALADRHAEVVALLASRLEEGDLVRRADADGPDGVVYLRALLQRGSPAGYQRAIALGAKDVDGARMLALEAVAQNPGSVTRLDAAGLEALAQFLTRAPDGARRDAPANVVALLAAARWRLALPSDATARKAASESAWRHLADVEPDQRAAYGAALGGAGMAPPQSLFSDAPWTAVYFSTLPGMFNVNGAVPVAEGAREAPGPFLFAVARAVLALDDALAQRVLDWAVLGNYGRPVALPPGFEDATWARVLDRTAVFERSNQGTQAFVASAAAQSGDPAFVGIAKRWLSRPDVNYLVWSTALPLYKGADRVDLWAFALEQPAFATSNPNTATWRAAIEKPLADDARASGADAALATVRRLRATSPAAAARLVEVLVDLRARAGVAALCDDELRAATPSAAPVRAALIRAASALHLREASPFLLREYQEGLSNDAGRVLSEIRDYHQRLAELERWAHADASVRDVSDLLADPDPQIRRAAVLTLESLKGREALPHLVRLAKDEKDVGVRQAALDAIERIAKTSAR